MKILTKAEHQKELIKLNKALNKQCEDKVNEAFKVADKRTEKLLKLQIMVIKKLLLEYALIGKPVSIKQLLRELNKL